MDKTDGGSAIKKQFPNKLGRYVNKNRTQMMCKWSEHYNLSKILDIKRDTGGFYTINFMYMAHPPLLDTGL